MIEKFDLIIVGTGFASSFFLDAYLAKAKPTTRILILERGRLDTHAWQVKNRTNTSQNQNDIFINKHPQKKWIFTPSFGGGSNCWWGVTPRMMPNDFRMQSVYGVSVDWPISYEELETFYAQTEEIMSISGPEDGSPFPRSTPYPQPPHRFTDPDKVLKEAYPDLFFHLPTARGSRATPNRPRCCATGVCNLCPINAKFTVLNEMKHLYEDSRVTLILEATVQTVETKGGVATGVSYLKNGVVSQAGADIVVLGGNAIFNPHILQRSNIRHPLLGKYLDEQIALKVSIDLDGLNNFQGSSSNTGHGYMLYDGEHRKEHAGCLIETWNTPNDLRIEQGKWQQRLILRVIYENLPTQQNYVKYDQNNPDLPETVYTGPSDYALKAMEKLPSILPGILGSLPIENILISDRPHSTEAHILGTTVMGHDPQTSVIDKHLIHHQVRNLLVLGSGAFPTVAPANPTLTISALSLWAAHHLLN
jgi:choline dehydrogenase-like flavoprotein